MFMSEPPRVPVLRWLVGGVLRPGSGRNCVKMNQIRRDLATEKRPRTGAQGRVPARCCRSDPPVPKHRALVRSLTRPRHAARRDSDAGPIAGLGQVTAFY